MVWIDSEWRIRRVGLAGRAEFTCWNDHRVLSEGTRHHRRRQRVPTAGVVACTHGYTDESKRLVFCEALLYVLKMSAGLWFVMDLTEAESSHIEVEEMDLDDIVVFFGVHFPGVSERRSGSDRRGVS